MTQYGGPIQSKTDDGATAIAVNQAFLVTSGDSMNPTILGYAVISGSQASGNVRFSTSNPTAGTTQTQAGATALTADLNAVTTGNASDGVRLPAAVAGLEIVVANLSASNAAKVYGAGSDTINGTAGATGVALATSAVTIYYCFQATKWLSK